LADSWRLLLVGVVTGVEGDEQKPLAPPVLLLLLLLLLFMLLLLLLLLLLMLLLSLSAALSASRVATERSKSPTAS
jgi:hypothetical protein